LAYDFTLLANFRFRFFLHSSRGLSTLATQYNTDGVQVSLADRKSSRALL